MSTNIIKWVLFSLVLVILMAQKVKCFEGVNCPAWELNKRKEDHWVEGV